MFYQWNVIGHEKELIQLETDFQNNNIHHAYLFAGPEKVGKFRVAKAAAKILQCPNNFCHTCPTCVQIEKKCQPDTIELEDDGESVKIQAIREILGRLNMTGQSQHKILLVQNIGRLTSEASNCLLKTLEEPTGKTVFIFTASQVRDVLPTIASRMRIIHFKKLPDAVLREALRKEYPALDDETLNQVILLSLGRSGRALQILANPEVFEELREVYRQIEFFDEKAGVAARISAMQTLAQDPVRTKTFLSLLSHYLRQKMLHGANSGKRLRALRTIEKTNEANRLLEQNVNPRLLLENIMLAL